MDQNQEIQQILKKHWGYDEFRPGQSESIEAALTGRDVFVLFPTGGGKSVCFQISALAKDGICVVISPLIALMQDQVQQLRDRGVKADYLHSGMSFIEIDRLLDNAIYGGTKLLYVAPERLKHPLTLERLRQMDINLIAIDEAHCISQWGHDFRPAYREIYALREEFPDVPVMALTATATKRVKEDIGEQLQLRNPFIYTKSFVRDNLHFVVRGEQDKINQLVHILNRVEGSAIVYVRSRKKTTDLAQILNERGIRAAGYHAGVSHKDRQNIMESWMSNKIRVVCATNAFGMGVDKADVRIVVHVDIPPSLEEYYQEAGRAGRDGQKAYCLILYNEADVLLMESKFKLAFPELDEIKRVYACLGQFFHLATGSGEGESFDFDFQSFVETYHLGYQAVAHILRILEQSGWISVTDSFYQPSKVMMVADKMLMYDYQLKHKSAATFIKTLLRTYEGLYSQYTRISESFLSNALKSNESIITQLLEQLHADGILDFEAASDSAKISFLLPRSTADNFNIDKKLFDFRKKMMKARVDAVMNFVNTTSCRMQNLLEYFGEDNVPRCGKCDRCIEKKDKPDESTYIKFKTIVLKNLENNSTIKEMVSLFPSNRIDQVHYVLRRMEEESWIQVQDDHISLHESKQTKS